MWNDIYPVEMAAEIRIQELRINRSKCLMARWWCTHRHRELIQRWLSKVYASIVDLFPPSEDAPPLLAPDAAP